MRNPKTLLAIGACVMLFTSCAGTSGERASGVSEEQCLKLDPTLAIGGRLEGATTAEFTKVTKYADGSTSESRVIRERASDELTAETLETTGYEGESVTKYIATPGAVYVRFPAGTLEDVKPEDWVRFTDQEPVGAAMLENAVSELNSGSVIPGESNLAEWLSQASDELRLSTEATATFQSADDVCRFTIDADGTQVSIATDREGRLTDLKAKDGSDTEVTISIGYKPVDIAVPNEDELAPDTAAAAFVGKMNLEAVETSALAFNRQLTTIASMMGATEGGQTKSTRDKVVIAEALGAQDGPPGVTIMAQSAEKGGPSIVLWDGESVMPSAMDSADPYPAYLQFVRGNASVCLRLSDDGSSSSDTTDGGTKTGDVVLSENISDGDTGAGWLVVRRVATGSKTVADKANACNGAKALTGTAGGVWSAGAAMTGW